MEREEKHGKERIASRGRGKIILPQVSGKQKNERRNKI